MSSTTTPPVECTVLFSDVVDSTQLYERIGNASAFKLVDQSLRLIKDVIESKDGLVVKHTGDGLMAIFKRADDAADAAISMHNALRDQPLGEEQQPMAVRTGFHYGSVIRSDNDIFGETVNFAARLTEIASSGRAVTTAETVEQMSVEWQGQLTPLSPRILRGTSRPANLYELKCESLGDITVLRNTSYAADENTELRLYLNEQRLILNEAFPIARLGRDIASDLRINDTRASRRHAEIMLRGDKFVLIDRSSNGTYIAINGEKEFFLRREEAILSGKGHFALGETCVANPYTVSFICL